MQEDMETVNTNDDAENWNIIGHVLLDDVCDNLHSIWSNEEVTTEAKTKDIAATTTRVKCTTPLTKLTVLAT